MGTLSPRCHVGLDEMSLKKEFVERLGRLLPLDAVFCASVDPATLLFTSALLEQIPRKETPRFLKNEFLEDDVNKFQRPSLVAGSQSTRWIGRRDVNGPQASAIERSWRHLDWGTSYARRSALGECWGFMCLHREDASVGSRPRSLASSRGCRRTWVRGSVGAFGRDRRYRS